MYLSSAGAAQTPRLRRHPEEGNTGGTFTVQTVTGSAGSSESAVSSQWPLVCVAAAASGLPVSDSAWLWPPCWCCAGGSWKRTSRYTPKNTHRHICHRRVTNREAVTHGSKEGQQSGWPVWGFHGVTSYHGDQMKEIEQVGGEASGLGQIRMSERANAQIQMFELMFHLSMGYLRI